ncbi:MAG: NACHT domain-containing NTPase [Anaerolineae bacterium]|nr:NACHT domain-containing NTPase [Anaerolineae bacterium]
MPTIPAGLQNRLRHRLLRCAPVDSDAALHAVFSDARIAQWQDAVPQADSPSARVDRLIAYLGDHYNSGGESALLLFLHVLLDHTSPADQCYQDLSALIIYLKDQLGAGVPSSPQWEAALARYREGVRQRHGTTRIFGQPRPVPLDDIFTEVYIHDQPSAFRRFDIRRLQQDPAHLEQAKRVPGAEIFQQEGGHRLFILGKPGAGKTTFLKHLAFEATNDPQGKVPIFVMLKDWTDSGATLLDFIVEQFTLCGFPSAVPFLEHLLANTEDALVLFDGLDEITQEGERRNRAIQDLRDFCLRYPRAQVLITCRVAATDYTFDAFTYVEVADFTGEQITAFVKKWFIHSPEKSASFLQELEMEHNRGLRELARQPLLLAMLCLAFNDALTFPQRRVEIYHDALDALLRKWDSSRNIRRAPIYEGLSIGRKHQLFARIAAQAFELGEYFLPQTTLEHDIAVYLQRLPRADAVNTTDFDVVAVLQAIAAQHGVLVERAHRIYSFAHLTFQEYYTAHYVVQSTASGDSGAIRRLLTHAADARWREVILLTASMLDDADDFSAHFMDALDAIAHDDDKLATFLAWAQRKAATVQASYHPAAVRAYYAYLNLALYPSLFFGLNRDHVFSFDISLDLNIELTIRIGTSGLPTTEAQDSIFFSLANAFELVRALDLNLAHALARDRDLSIAVFLNRDLAKELDLKDLHRTLTAFDPLTENVHNVAGQDFAAQLHTNIVENYDIGYDWDFTEEQARAMEHYFTAANLLVECLDVAYVTDRATIEDRLLLPPTPQESPA